MIKSILGGKSKNLCDLAYLLTLPLDKTFNNQGFWRVLINAEPNTTYTFSRENANQITEFENSYLAISTYDDITHNYWLSHSSVPVLNHKSATLTTSSDGKLWILFNENFYKNYWQKNLNPFGYIQLELGSTATEYVPHELTSYKSIMKVSDGHFVTSFDERMPCKTKNLFSSSTEVGIPSSTKSNPSEKRLLEDGKWYVGFSKNNYYRGPQSDWLGNFQYNIWENSISLYTNLDGYGLAKCVYVEPNTSYTLSFKVSGRDHNIGFGFYQEDGTFIDYLSGKNITTPENCKFITVVFAFGVDRNKETNYFSDIQLVKGTTATDYVPYGNV